MGNRIIPQIEAWLVENRPDYHALLNPPAQEYLFAGLGLLMPDDLKRFYQWHDGQQAKTFDSLLENLTFMPLMDIATTHQMLRDVSMFEGWDDNHWHPSWIPFLSNGGGDYLCVATEDCSDIPSGAVIWYDHESVERDVQHKDFDAFLTDLYDRMLTDRLGCG